MSFVKDDSARTRGVGAIASMDMASPRRRIAAALQNRALARRDAVMARSTLGRAPMVTSPDTGTYGARSIDVDYFGRGAGGLKQPTGPTGGGVVAPIPMPSSDKWGAELLTYQPSTTPPPAPAPTLTTPRNGTRSLPPRSVTKLPGSVTTAETKNGTTKIVNGNGTVDVKPTTPTKTDIPPPKTATVIVGGGASPPWTGVSQPTPAPMVAPPLEPIPELVGPSSAAPVKPKTSSNTLLYAALGVGALWLLTRE